MRFGDHIKEIKGIRYLSEELELLSPAGRRCMLNSEMITTAEEIENALNEVQIILDYLKDKETIKAISEVCLRLMQLKDVGGSVTALRTKATLTDIDLFEIKNLALIATAVEKIRKESLQNLQEIPDLSSVVKLLDPEGKRIPTFYVYDCYDIELAELRKQHKNLPEGDERDELWIKISQVEDRVKRRLSRQLEPMGLALQDALNLLGHYDLIIAKGKLTLIKGYVRPTISKDPKSSFVNLRHPQVEAILKTRGQKFQPVSLKLSSGVALVTGANMAGKSVLLRSLAVAQLMTQYGYFLPVDEAVVYPVEEVMLCIGDAQDETEGLSSYGAEMLRMSGICETVAQGKSVLALIDEPARTTNPVEGQAIVSGLVELLSAYPNALSVITTHYGSISAKCRRLRVRGFVEERVKLPLHVNELNKCIDYSLEEVQTKDVPHEAIRIAQILGVCPELIERSTKYIK